MSLDVDPYIVADILDAGVAHAGWCKDILVAAGELTLKIGGGDAVGRRRVERGVAGRDVGRILENLDIGRPAAVDAEAHAGYLREEVRPGARDAIVEQLLDL